ncbi:MAG: hypothetical protein SNJ84_02015 [Verrucomicrobiia bacterium]
MPVAPYDLPGEVFLHPGPLRYAFRIERTGPEFLVTGWFALEFKVACARCLEPIPWAVRIESFAVSYEAAGLEILDLTERIREDTLLALPMAPACALDPEQRCPITGATYREGPDTFAEWHRNEAWEALNQLNDKQK